MESGVRRNEKLFSIFVIPHTVTGFYKMKKFEDLHSKTIHTSFLPPPLSPLYPPPFSSSFLTFLFSPFPLNLKTLSPPPKKNQLGRGEGKEKDRKDRLLISI